MVAKKSYVPDRGDIAWLDLDPTRGHEQRGRRPVLIISPRRYNARADLALACPITSQEKGYPFEVPVRAKGIEGVVLADQVRAIDWKERKLTRLGSASESAVSDVQELLKKLILEV